jgi:D-sedoheptulose 7-phosphate isomerase
VGTVLADAIALHRQCAAADLQPVYGAATLIVDAFRAGGKLLVFGNGGSAADAQHVAAELVGRFERVRQPLAAIALTADTSVMTSVANDEGYAEVFVRQVEALGRSGDVVLAISTSGRSPNVVAALRTARARGLMTIGLTGGNGGEAGPLCDVHVNVPADNTARVQEVHRTLLHAICGLVEQAAGQSSGRTAPDR